MREAMGNIIKGSGLEDQVIPKWGVGCRRITPGVGYLQALVDPKTEVVGSGVKAVTRKGCLSEEGKEYDVDVIICATGFDTSYLPRFPVLGMNGEPLAEAWKDEPKNYFGMAAPGFPNYFMLIGPNSPIGNGPVLIGIGTIYVNSRTSHLPETFQQRHRSIIYSNSLTAIKPKTSIAFLLNQMP
jgi:cation diffusion facilitator CzcD-associated flavoprotein CzcO